MKSAFNDIIYEKRGIYGVLHVIILLLSLFLIVVISVDTFLDLHVLYCRFRFGVFLIKT